MIQMMEETMITYSQSSQYHHCKGYLVQHPQCLPCQSQLGVLGIQELWMMLLPL